MDLVDRDGVTILEVVPLLLHSIVELQEQSGKGLKTVKQLISMGEPLSGKLANRFLALNPGVTIINAYGQTEGSDDYTYYRLTSPEEREYVLIGKPIRNMQIYIFDNNNNIQPIGIPGELCISGDGVARGYLNRPELTAQKFVENPVVPGERMYRSGDLARWLPDGNLECLGRIDHQVKVRGFRIELGEIENRLHELESVKEVVVMARDNDVGDKSLCAYFTADEAIPTSDLRRQLSQTLPSYMIPSHFVQLETMPLTTSGKVDRKVLPLPEGGSEAKYVAPRNAVEATLVNIWSEVLAQKKVGIYDNFFELGGHSLKAVTIVNRIANELGAELPLAELYTNPYIAAAREYIHRTKRCDVIENIEGVLLLKRGEQTDKNFFMVHAGNGKGAAYIKLAHHLNDALTYWGIDYEKPNAYDPCVASIEKLAANYVEKIRKIQPKGPYYISGWCFGGTVAVEMARQLEAVNEELKFVGMFNTPAVKWNRVKPLVRSRFTVNMKAEFKLVRRLFPESQVLETNKDIASVVDLWDQIVKDLEVKAANDHQIKEKAYHRICLEAPFIKKVVKDHTQATIGEIIHHFNLFRGLANNYGLYIPKGKINAKINYFVASREESGDKMLWSKQSHQKIDFHHVDADHFSMFEQDEDVKKLAFMLTGVLGKCDQEVEEV